MEKKIKYLPLGSVVVLKGGIKKLIIVARGLQIKYGEEDKFFDYGASEYPDGIVGDKLAYFNHDAITKVVFEGYSDDDDKTVVENINRFLAENSVTRVSNAELEKAGNGSGVNS